MLNMISAKGSMQAKVPACGSCPVGLEPVLQQGGFLCVNGVIWVRLGQTSDSSITWTDLLNQYLRSAVGCILMASSKVLSRDVGVCLSVCAPSRTAGHKQHPTCQVTRLHPCTQG